jgi:hypothetical protein
VVLDWDSAPLAGFASAYEAALPAIENYVRAGGVVWIQGAIQGDTSDSFALPFGGVLTHFTDSANNIVDPAHPIVAGLANPVKGDDASHTCATEIPMRAQVIARRGIEGNEPTLFVYGLLLFRDGFESASLAHWSATAP